jgi:hypothetical protein
VTCNQQVVGRLHREEETEALAAGGPRLRTDIRREWMPRLVSWNELTSQREQQGVVRQILPHDRTRSVDHHQRIGH